LPYFISEKGMTTQQPVAIRRRAKYCSRWTATG
jgi:hypothetical protein